MTASLLPLSIENYKEVLFYYISSFNLQNVDYQLYLSKIQSGLANEMDNKEFAFYASEVAANLVTSHTDYSELANIIIVKYLHSTTLNSFSEKIAKIQKAKKNLNNEVVDLIMKHAHFYDSVVDYSRDYEINYFGTVSLLRSYCIKINEIFFERPQDVYMRVAIQLHRDDFENVKNTYYLLSKQIYTHATPTLYNSCFIRSQLASCLLVAMKEDTIKGIFDTLTDIALHSKNSGGMGLHISNLRANKSPLMTTGGVSGGIVPVIKLINDACVYINQGASRRTSALACYLEPWHKDVFDFLELRKNFGDESRRSRDTFTALWVPDLFMERVKNNDIWSLFDPNEAKGLQDLHNEEFNKKYLYYEKTKSRKVVNAQDLWKEMIITQIETGGPYMLYKDAANRLSNQNNLGTIKSSNLCAEIIEYSDKDETACCILASICLPKFVATDEQGKKYFDFSFLREVVHQMVVNLNSVLDSMFYSSETAKTSNMRHRPLGIGVQGLADLFMILRYPFGSSEAKKLNSEIFEAMYFAALEKSNLMAMEKGPYSSFQGSALSKGIFQFNKYGKDVKLSGFWNWEELRRNIMAHGTRNSLLLALMPTAGTSQICGNFECFEPITSNIFTRRTFAGEFQCVNKYLMEDLTNIGMWNEDIKQLIIEFNGSIQNIPLIPDEIKELHKTVWEIKMKTIIDMAVDRQYFVDQSQSLNLYIKQPTYAKVTSMHFYSWKNNLITGMYYLRTQPLASAIKFTVDREMIAKTLNTLNSSLKSDDSDENDSNICLPACDGCSG